MPRTPRKKENKEPVIIEEVKEPEPEPEVENRTSTSTRTRCRRND